MTVVTCLAGLIEGECYFVINNYILYLPEEEFRWHTNIKNDWLGICI